MNLRDLAAEFGVSIAILRKLLPDLFTPEMTGSTHITDETAKIARNAWNGKLHTQQPDFVLFFGNNADYGKSAYPNNADHDREAIVIFYEEPIIRQMGLYITTGNGAHYNRLRQMLRQGLEHCFESGRVQERLVGEAALMDVAESLVKSVRSLVDTTVPADTETPRGRTAKITIDLTVGMADDNAAKPDTGAEE